MPFLIWPTCALSYTVHAYLFLLGPCVPFLTQATRAFSYTVHVYLFLHGPCVPFQETVLPTVNRALLHQSKSTTISLVVLTAQSRLGHPSTETPFQVTPGCVNLTVTVK